MRQALQDRNAFCSAPSHRTTDRGLSLRRLRPCSHRGLLPNHRSPPPDAPLLFMCKNSTLPLPLLPDTCPPWPPWPTCRMSYPPPLRGNAFFMPRLLRMLSAPSTATHSCCVLTAPMRHGLSLVLRLRPAAAHLTFPKCARLFRTETTFVTLLAAERRRGLSLRGLQPAPLSVCRTHSSPPSLPLVYCFPPISLFPPFPDPSTPLATCRMSTFPLWSSCRLTGISIPCLTHTRKCAPPH